MDRSHGAQRGIHLLMGAILLTSAGRLAAADPPRAALPEAAPPEAALRSAGEMPVPPATMTPTTTGPVGDPAAPLVPGQVIQPIDLATALRLGGANDLDIAIARERVCQALADLQLARTVWLPSLFVGPNWIRHDGTAQVVEGRVQNISKSSLFLGGTLAGGNGVSGPIPAGGPAPLGSLTTILRFSDAIFQPLAARQMLDARRAGVAVANNDTFLSVAEAYLNLQESVGRLMIAREAAEEADELARLTASFARTGAGLDADYRRSLVERDLRRRETAAAVGELEVASAELIRQIRLDPRVVVAPVEPPESMLRIVPETMTPDDLIVTGLHHRPELGEAQALVKATLVRLRQARLRPWIPSLAFRYSAGGFGGGPNATFNDFGGRHDADVNLFWQLQGMGFSDRAIAKSHAAQNRAAVLEKLKIQDRIAAEVMQADKLRLASARQVAEAGHAVPEAIASLKLNLTNIRRGAGLPGATRPIEVLQPIQALASARTAYLEAVLNYNRAQFRLFHALGCPPTLAPQGLVPVPAEPVPREESIKMGRETLIVGDPGSVRDG